MKEEKWKLSGLCFSPYLDGQSPGSPIHEKQIENRLYQMKNQFQVNGIRTYGCTGNLEWIPRIAKSMGLTTSIGAWLSLPSSSSFHSNNDIEINQLITLCNQRDEHGNLLVNVAIVGNETLLRKDLSIDQLIQYIKYVRDRIPKEVLITTAEPYGLYYKYPQLISHIDIVYVHIYAYWDAIDINSAVSHTENHYNKMTSMSNGKKVIISEVGWPSSGEIHANNESQKAVPSLENASRFFNEFLSWANAKEVDFYYFEAFDEKWKALHEGERGAHWGIMDSCGVVKWSYPHQEKSNEIAISFVDQQEIFTRGRIRGRVENLTRGEYCIAIYIKVNAHFWSKPSFDSPTIPIKSQDQSFDGIIFSGDGDAKLSELMLFLIPTSYEPPKIGGIESIPRSLYLNSIYHQKISRGSVPCITLKELPFNSPSGTLSGCTSFLDNPYQFHIAVFIKVGGGWWTKPTFVQNTLFINPHDCSFSSPIFTGPNDSSASDLAIFLLSKDHFPPKIAGDNCLPHDLFESCLANQLISS